MIRIGNQTSCWAPRLAEPFDYAVANGFNAFEWFPDKKPGTGWDDSDLDASQRQKIKETAKEKGIRLSVHARWQANPFHPEATELFRKDIQLARDLGAALLNIHLYHELGIERFINAVTPLIRETANAGLRLSIENTPEHSPEQFNELFRRLRELDSVPIEHVGMCLDLGHANLSGATRNDYLAFVDRLDRDIPIAHLHLHENWGDGDTHLTLFTGPAARNDAGIRGFVERMHKRKFLGSIILEQWPQPPTLLNQARESLRELFKEHSNAPSNQDSLRIRGAAGSLRQACHSPAPSTTLVGCGVPNPPQSAGSTGEQNYFKSLVEGDKRSRSWREKLDAVRELMVSRNSQLGDEELAYLAIYLRFLSAGQVACTEDGRHFRPDHHARISREIQERLQTNRTPADNYLIRKIYAALPSSAQEFQRAEPLTRIRDIAHRNDIPSDLKREIKTTLQNKLHRCAGPEDLETSQKVLERITAPGANYSAEFVGQFKIFHEELKEFFNARALEERLNALSSAVDSEQAELIRGFLAQKWSTGFEGRLSAFKILTGLRDSLTSNGSKSAKDRQQEFIVADIGLEDFAYVLASQLLNDFEASEPRRSGVDLLEPLGLIVRNLALSDVGAKECKSIGAELDEWRKDFDPGDREQLLRMKATVERSRRLAEVFSERVIGSMLSRAEELGKALGVAEQAMRVFCEAEIRSHVVYQLSKIASILLKRLREALELPAWDVLVSGRAIGSVKILERLDGAAEIGAERVIAILKKAAGDEEIPRAVKGILLAHEIPHLSHLGVRARQGGVVFVSTEDRSNFTALEELNNRTIQLNAAPDKVEWVAAKEDERAESREPANIRTIPRRKINRASVRDGEPATLSIEQVSVESGGQKAFGLKKLTELSAVDSFLVPRALVIPFGVMEKGLLGKKALNAEYWDLANELNGESVQDSERKVERLRAIIEQVPVSGEIISTIAGTFHGLDRLMVRSSANCEDLEDFAGAGLYESIPIVNVAEAAAAIRRVWSSLWTRRAELSRRQAGIPHEEAQMAVIIQKMIAAEYSFVLHTVNPLTRNSEEVYAEMAIGLGETLASAAEPGTPYRLACNKKSGEVQTLAFSNFSHALRAGSAGGVHRELIDYSRVPLSRESEMRRDIGGRLAAIGRRVENDFGKPQDIEGAIMENKIYLVQSRPQQGI